MTCKIRPFEHLIRQRHVGSTMPDKSSEADVDPHCIVDRDMDIGIGIGG